MIDSITSSSLVNTQSLKLPCADGKCKTLSDYFGKVLLVVNIATQCDFAYQLNSLYLIDLLYAPRGLEILAFPCNDFGSQEPDPVNDVNSFLRSTFRLNFDHFAKIHCIGDDQLPLYKYLVAQSDCKPIAWNYEKFLLDREGRFFARFETKVQFTDPRFTAAIEQLLNQF